MTLVYCRLTGQLLGQACHVVPSDIIGHSVRIDNGAVVVLTANGYRLVSLDNVELVSSE